jgi:hypothetical protein
MKLSTIAVAISLAIVSSHGMAAASDITPPVGFEDLYERQSMITKFYINDSDFIELVTEGTFDEVFLDADEQEKLIDFLKMHFVDEKNANEFAKNLVGGMQSSDKCIGNVESCQFVSQQFDIVYSQDDRFVRMFFAPDLMNSQNGQKQYISSKVGRSALISSSDLYATVDSEANSSLTWNNFSTLHVLGGQFTSDISTATTGEDKFDYNELSYTYAMPATNIQLGYFNDTKPYSFNSTDILADDSNYSEIAFRIGSSSDLEKVNKENSKRLYFSSPAAGRVQIIKDNKIVLSENAQSGQNFIPYYKLPKGNYDAIIRVYNGDQIAFEEHRKIFNSDKHNLAVGDMDYQFSLGKFMELNNESFSDNAINSLSREFDEQMFARSEISYKAIDDLTLAAGVLNTKNSWYAKTAVNFDFNEQISSRLLYGRFSNQSDYRQVGVTLFNASVDWSRYNDRGDNTVDELDDYLFGFGSYTDLSVSYYQQIGVGNAYVSYSKGRDVSTEDYIFSSDEGLLKSYENYNAGYTFPWLYDSMIDVNLGYNKNEDVDSDYTVGINISVPLSINDSVTVSSYTDRPGKTSFRTAYGRDDLLSSKNGALSGEVGVGYDGYQDQTMSADLSMSGTYSNDALSSSAYAHVDSRGEMGLNGSLHTTQVVTTDNIYSTPTRADSYLVVSNQSQDSSLTEQRDDIFNSTVKVKRNGDPERDFTIDDDVKLYPLKRYKEYQVTLDVDSSDYYNNGSNGAIASSYPGTIVDLNVDLHEVRSYISIFNDLDGRAIDTVTCRGIGCVSVEELSDGVFKFKVRMGMPYELQANNQRCLIPNLNSIENRNLGENFCMPQFDIDDDGYQIAKGAHGTDKNLYYVGEFDDTTMMRKLIDSTKDEPFEFINKTVGKREFLFIKLDGFLTAEQGSKLDAMKAYAVESRTTETYVSN